METPRYRGSIVGPIILIGLGIIFLLQNTGAVSWDAWRVIIKLWPVLLIAVGLDIMFGRRSAAGAVLVPLAVLGLVGFGAWVVWSQAPGAGWVREQVHETVAGADRADVDINFAAGVLRVGSTPGADMLISGFVSVAPDDRVSRSFSVSGDTAYYRLEDHAISVIPFVGEGGVDRLWELNLGRQVPMRLNLDTGAGSSRIDLTDVQVTDLRVHTGVGEVILTVPGRGAFSAVVEGGIGQVTVKIPRGMAARVRVQTGIGGQQVSGDFDRQGDTYTTPDYATASDRVDLDVKGGIGEVVIEGP